MRIARRCALALLLTACSCGHGERTEARTEGTEPTSSGAAATSAAVEEEVSAPTAPPADPPEVELVADVDPYARVTLSIRNRSDARQRLSSTLVLERGSGEAFADAELGTFQLGAELASEGCVELLPGAELTGTWSCLRGDAEGLVRDCAMAPAGTYRFVAVSCEGGARTPSASFEFVSR